MLVLGRGKNIKGWGLIRRTQLDEVADGAHGDEAHGNGLGNFDKLFAVGFGW